MPELPDLHIYAHNLRKQFLQKKIKDVLVFADSRISVDKQMFIDSCVGSSFNEIVQSGKEISFHLESSNSFNVHLMLLGRFVTGEKSSNAMVKNKIATVVFLDSTTLNICDEQMFAKIEFNPEKKLVPDALSEDFTYSYFLSVVLRSPRKNIKALLLDQKNIRGIGNAYVDEILYRAIISPKSKTGKIPESEIERLYKEIGDTLRWGIDNIKRISPNVIAGEQRAFFAVHNKVLRQTKKGEQIIVEKIVSKKTYYTSSQRLYE